LKKKSLEISDGQKVAVLKRNRKLADRAFAKKPCSMYQEEFVKLIRTLFDYSEHTGSCDILRSFERLYRTIHKYTEKP